MSDNNQNQSPEELYRQTLEDEFAQVAEAAEPSYHPHNRPSRAMGIYQNISANPHIVVENFDYQVTRIELKPVRKRIAEDNECSHEEHDNMAYADQMQEIRKRQKYRKCAPTGFSTCVDCGQYHDAFHMYMAEATENSYDPLLITPKRVTTDPDILTIDGCDYVLEDCLISRQAYQHVKHDLDPSPRASIDQWPEEVVLHDPDGTGSKTYIRCDVVYWDDDEKDRVDHRLFPKDPDCPKPPAASGRSAATTKKSAPGRKASGRRNRKKS